MVIELLKENKPITLYDGGTQLRDYMHVSDVCEALKLIDDCGEIDSIYNVSGGNPRPFKEIIDTCKDILGSESELISIETPKFNQIVQVKNFYLNVDKLKSLEFRENVPLKCGLQNMCF